MKAIHLCCGAGGTTAGFHWGGISTAFAFDNNPIVVATHQANFPGAPCLVRDIKEIKVEDLPDADVWTCGIPCAPYSSAGTRMMDRDPRDITPELVRLISDAAAGERLLPDWFFFENVPPYRGSVSHGKLYSTIANLGYHILDAIFCHANFGVPQRRNRWHMIACRDFNRVIEPEPTHTETPDLFGLKPWRRFGEIREANPEKIQVLTPVGLRGLLRRQRRKVASATALNTSPYNVLQVIRDEDMMPTVTASWYKGLARNQTTAVACPAKVNGHNTWYYRMPTELEVKRAQGFSDFVFLGTKRERWEMIGRAVPPPFAFAVAQVINSK